MSTKRYQIQKYDGLWESVSETDNEKTVLTGVKKIITSGHKARVNDRLTGTVVMTANAINV